MEWWLASLDPESCKKYNVAARWALRQSGVVRARCEEFDPADLKGTTEVRRADPDTGADIVTTEADPFAGIRKLLLALEASMCRTEMDRKAELRKQFYQTIRRAAGERISTFCTRYRTLIGEMRREGITLPAGELGWFLKDRLGLDALRVLLLDTALQGKEDYEEVEREVLRLFRDLHVSDPLYKSKPVGGNDNKSYPLQRFLQSSNQHGLRSGAPSSAGSSVKSFKTSSSYRFGRPSSSASSGRQAYVVEDAADVEPEVDEELIPDDGDGNANSQSLEEVLQCEAEVLAAEIQELEESGEFDTAVLEELEAGVEQAAESLVTMREARSRINEIKKDRGFGRAPAGSKLKLNGNQVEKKKQRRNAGIAVSLGTGEATHNAPSLVLDFTNPRMLANAPLCRSMSRLSKASTLSMCWTSCQSPMRSTWSTTIACDLRKPWNPQSRKTSPCLACRETKF
jgi:hypothetical protein